MRDTAIIHEGTLGPGEPGWQVKLSDGAIFTARPPSGSTVDGRWSVGLRFDDDGAESNFWATRRTLVAAIADVCQTAAYEGRTAHVLAAITAALA